MPRDLVPSEGSQTEISVTNLPPVLQAWKTAVENGDPAEVVKVYHPLGLLEGTMWSRYVCGHEDIRQYFDEFMQGKYSPGVEFNSLHISPTGNAYGGEYTFHWKTDVENAEEKELKANYTFESMGDKIAIHHSSTQEIPAFD